MVRIEVWPFLVSRSAKLGHQVVLAPDFMVDAASTSALSNDTVGEPGDDPRVRELVRTRVGDLTLIYRIVEARIDGRPLQDGHGRPVESVEGVVVRGRKPARAPTRAQLEELHERLTPSYRRFWQCSEPPPPERARSYAIELGETGDGRAAPPSTSRAEREPAAPASGQRAARRPRTLPLILAASALAMAFVIYDPTPPSGSLAAAVEQMDEAARVLGELDRSLEKLHEAAGGESGARPPQELAEQRRTISELRRDITMLKGSLSASSKRLGRLRGGGG